MSGDPAATPALIMDLDDGQEAPPATPALIMDLGDGQEDAPSRPETPVVDGAEGRSIMDDIEDTERDAQEPGQGPRPDAPTPRTLTMDLSMGDPEGLERDADQEPTILDVVDLGKGAQYREGAPVVVALGDVMEDARRRGPDLTEGLDGQRLSTGIDDPEDLARDAGRRQAAPVVVALDRHERQSGDSTATSRKASQLRPPAPKFPRAMNPSAAGRIMRKAQSSRRSRPGRPKSGNPILRPKMPAPASGGSEKSARRPKWFAPPRMPGQRR